MRHPKGYLSDDIEFHIIATMIGKRKRTTVPTDAAASKRRSRTPMPARVKTYSLQKSSNSFITNRTVLTDATLASTAGVTSVAYYWTLDQLPGYTEYTSLFDQYRIKKVDVLIQTKNPIGSGPFGYSPVRIMGTPDFDDSTPASTESDIQQYQNLQVWRPNTDKKFTIIPRIAKAAYSGAFTSYSNDPAGWLDVASPSVRHYGLKVLITADTGSGDDTCRFNVISRVYLEFKSQR